MFCNHCCNNIRNLFIRTVWGHILCKTRNVKWHDLALRRHMYMVMFALSASTSVHSCLTHYSITYTSICNFLLNMMKVTDKYDLHKCPSNRDISAVISECCKSSFYLILRLLMMHSIIRNGFISPDWDGMLSVNRHMIHSDMSLGDILLECADAV
jgi:hypothetical protein